MALNRRMDFSIQCAYVYGTCALRTHLINLTEKQEELTWGAFSHLRRKWAGKVSQDCAICEHPVYTCAR